MRKMSPEAARHRQRTAAGVLTEAQVARAKARMLIHGESPRELAREMNVSLWTMRAIKRGDTWDWVIPDETRLEPVDMSDDAIAAAAAKIAAGLQKAGLIKRLDNELTEFVKTEDSGAKDHGG